MASKKNTTKPEEDLYMMVAPKMYRASKSGILRSQADLLNSLKRIHNLQVLERQKRDLKIELHRLLSSTLDSISKIQEKLPEPRIPREIEVKVSEVKIIEKKAPEKKRKSSMRESIDEELQQIQDKLKQING